MGERQVTAEVLASEIEAQLVASVLTERGIPHSVRSYRDTAYGGLFQFDSGWGIVMSPERWVDQVREVVAAVRESADTGPGFDA
jgi:hypothetical protein